MRVRIFSGEGAAAATQYSIWAKDKMLTKDVIIHTHIIKSTDPEMLAHDLVIIVFFDEAIHPSW